MAIPRDRDVVAVDSARRDRASPGVVPCPGRGTERRGPGPPLGSDFDYAIHLDADEKLAEARAAAALESVEPGQTGGPELDHR